MRIAASEALVRAIPRFSKLKYTVSETNPMSASRPSSRRVSGSRTGRSRQTTHRMPPASVKRSSASSSGSNPLSAVLVATNESPKANVMPTAAA